MASADPQRVLREVYAALSRPSQLRLHYADVHAARVDAGWEILRAVAASPENPYYPSLLTLVTVAHNSFLPAHDGEPGTPVIVPFPGAPGREGVEAAPDEIESYRLEKSEGLAHYTNELDSGVATAHNEADPDGNASPLACRFSLAGGRFKFTGYSAQIPLIQLTRSMADTGVPEAYEPTLVKLTIPKLFREGDSLALFESYRALGQEDLVGIRGGAARVRPVPSRAAPAAAKQG